MREREHPWETTVLYDSAGRARGHAGLSDHLVAKARNFTHGAKLAYPGTGTARSRSVVLRTVIATSAKLANTNTVSIIG